MRFDLAVRSPEYVRELAEHHVGGYLKIAPEHVASRPLRLMQKPEIGTYQRFQQMFERASQAVGKQQYLIPYLIAAHPGADTHDMLELALWLKANALRPEQVQTFLPSPMTLATAMYHSGYNPLRPLQRTPEEVPLARGARDRRLHKAFLRYHAPENRSLLAQALSNLGRTDLIGRGKRHLVAPGQVFGKKHNKNRLIHTRSVVY